MSLLALILFAPWFLILIWAYWRFPTGLPRTAQRRWFDGGAVVIALAASAIAMSMTYAANATIGGAIWKQVVATVAGYALFLGVLAAAFALRGVLWPRR